MNTIKFNIRKPMYGNYCYLRGDWVEKAIRLGMKLDITIPNGRAIVAPEDWKDGCKMMKKVFKFRDNPMILYGNYLNIENKSVGKIIDSQKEEKQLNLF